ncbi:phosphoribosyltransferase [Methanomethylovorans sp.]|uniref:phosphoribosyltransferase n=1 Tax=Methanomethylovorans sp. TaxID=2758717 RepID=UPI003D0EE07C
MTSDQEKPKCCFLFKTGEKRPNGKDLYLCRRRDMKIGWPNNLCSNCNEYLSYYSPKDKSDEIVTEEELNIELNIIEKMRCKIFINPEQYITSIFSNQKLETYHSKAGGQNPNFDEISENILRVKNKEEDAIQYFIERLQSILSKDEEYVICVMPNSEKGICTSGMMNIAKSLCKSPIIDGTECIKRKVTVPKKSKSLYRKIDPEKLKQEIESLIIENETIIKGKQVLLLDDVATTGTSLKAGRSILKEAGAELVAAIVLGHTYKGY